MDLKQVSRSWHDYFEYGNPHTPLPWDDPYPLTPAERRSVAASMQQFQLGEGSDGKRLLRSGWDHGRQTSDPYFAAALSLFVREEQRHSEYLARFMDREHIPRLAAHWLDRTFRKLRGLAGLELSIRVLVTAEIVAVPYYRALEGATASPLLHAICNRILSDEHEHIRYQASNLARLSRHRGKAMQSLIQAAHCWFLVATALLVWILHRNLYCSSGWRCSRVLAEVLACWNSMMDDPGLARAKSPMALQAS
jgi:hypothetical protein